MLKVSRLTSRANFSISNPTSLPFFLEEKKGLKKKEKAEKRKKIREYFDYLLCFDFDKCCL